MQYSILAIATLIATVTAQTASGLPACATTCLNQLPKDCGSQDIGCICANKDFITNVSCCVSQNCPADQQAAALTFAKGICQAGGVTLTVTGATCIGSSTSGSASSTSASTSGAGSSSNTGTPTTTNLAASASSVSSSANSVLSSISSRISSASSGGAAPQVTAFAGLFGAAAAAVALL